MTNISRASRAKIGSIIAKLTPDELKRRTMNQGIADSPELRNATIQGSWFFLGVEMDPTGFQPIHVRLVDLTILAPRTVVLVEEATKRILAVVTDNQLSLSEWLTKNSILVDWQIQGAIQWKN